MEKSKFDQAFSIVLADEGGYSSNPNDPGNWTGGRIHAGYLKGTKYGISAKAYPDLDIKALTEDEAKRIYKKDYWDKYHCGDLTWPFALALFDAVVNQGPYAVKWMQQVHAVKADGLVGKGTITAVNNAQDILDNLARFMAERAKHYAGLPTFNVFGKGWMTRLFRIHEEAINA